MHNSCVVFKACSDHTEQIIFAGLWAHGTHAKKLNSETKSRIKVPLADLFAFLLQLKNQVD